MTDQLHKYLFTDKQTRIQTVFLETVWHKAFEHQAYPDAVKKLLGEFTAAAVLLAGNLKMQGSLILQAQGDGPIKLLVVECTSNLKVRATVHLQDDAIIPKKASLQSLLNPHGSARFSVILEPKGKDNFQPYQGIVPLQNDSVQEVLKEYMKQSEQLDTELCLAANQYRAAGILMQRLPNADASTLSNDEAGKENSWERNIPLFATIEPAELLNIDSDHLIRQLFWQDDLLKLPAQNVVWHCPCNRDRVKNMLRMLGQKEIQDLLKEQEQIEVSCQFCGHPYHFDVIDCAALFTTSSTNTPPPHLH